MGPQFEVSSERQEKRETEPALSFCISYYRCMGRLSGKATLSFIASLLNEITSERKKNCSVWSKFFPIRIDLIFERATGKQTTEICFTYWRSQNVA